MAPAITRRSFALEGGHSAGGNEAPADSHNEQSELGLSTAQTGMKRQPSSDEALLWRVGTAQAEYFHRKTSNNIEKYARDNFYAILYETF